MTAQGDTHRPGGKVWSIQDYGAENTGSLSAFFKGALMTAFTTAGITSMITPRDMAPSTGPLPQAGVRNGLADPPKISYRKPPNALHLICCGFRRDDTRGTAGMTRGLTHFPLFHIAAPVVRVLPSALSRKRDQGNGRRAPPGVSYRVRPDACAFYPMAVPAGMTRERQRLVAGMTRRAGGIPCKTLFGTGAAAPVPK